jgi:hypothetical protein
MADHLGYAIVPAIVLASFIAVIVHLRPTTRTGTSLTVKGISQAGASPGHQREATA